MTDLDLIKEEISKHDIKSALCYRDVRFIGRCPKYYWDIDIDLANEFRDFPYNHCSNEFLNVRDTYRECFKRNIPFIGFTETLDLASTLEDKKYDFIYYSGKDTSSYYNSFIVLYQSLNDKGLMVLENPFKEREVYGRALDVISHLRQANIFIRAKVLDNIDKDGQKITLLRNYGFITKE